MIPDEKTKIIFSGPGLPPLQASKNGSDKLDIVTIKRPGFNKHYITAHPDAGENPFSMFERLADCAALQSASITSQFVFGGTELHDGGMESLNNVFGKVEWPVTWIQGRGSSGRILTGTQAYAISGNSINMIRMDGSIIGNTYEDNDAQYCMLGDLRPSDTSLSRKDQTIATFENITKALALVGMDFSHVIRTWFYLENILDWYDDFNAVRTDFFKKHNVFGGLIPASTGIGVGNHAGAALVTDVLAIKPKTDKVKIFTVPSPLQCPAPDYKSSFSRAVEMQLPDHRQLFISGTASIEPMGKTAYIGDTWKQIELTMQVVEAILKSRGMSWSNTTRAIAYFTNVNDSLLLYKYCENNNLPRMPIAIAHSDICRDDLLFEIELDASIPS